MSKNSTLPEWHKYLPLSAFMVTVLITVANFYINNFSSSNSLLEKVIFMTLNLYGMYQIGVLVATNQKYDYIQQQIEQLLSQKGIEGATCSFNDLYKIMSQNLVNAEKEIKVSSYIDKDPEILSNSQKEYHKLFQEKIKNNIDIEICRIISVPNKEKLKWMQKLIKDFGDKDLYKNLTIYYDRGSSLAENGAIIPLNIQIYDDCVCIINPSCIKNDIINKKRCIYFKSQEIANSFSIYYDKLIEKFTDDWLIKDGEINHNLVSQIEQQFNNN